MHQTASNYFKQFIQQEAAGGILLIIAALLAIILANSPFSSFYSLLIDTPVEVRVGALEIAKPLLLWVNDGLMAIFFLLVGLELKRELLIGELSKPGSIILPGIGAVGGMLIPAAIYIWFNMDDPVALKGWAIPAATDIAFALGILSLLGNRVPVTIKIFLTSLAIFDDIGAILIIALFYTSQISMIALLIAAVCTLGLFILNRMQVGERSVYFFLGAVMWIALLKSGVHATLAGVLLAAFIPMKHKNEDMPSPLISLEHDLHSVVAFIILPVFAFCNAGINLSGVGIADIKHAMPLGIILGLFIGKQIGIFGLCWLSIKLKLAELPKGMNWSTLWGTSILCGIGFTMSLFIGSLAFEETGVNKLFDERLGILIGSLLAGVTGYIVLHFNLPHTKEKGGS
ncbi:Na+/H+ antiporter NhaA [Kordiimonas laminariae]|uniref:Na+/H+ antiporter NhaA n=1 Tax=Kordiimonas laminariae TaxID=2917717 RepID=UPI001FF6AB9F|nr:Na+/H+ antiporter NhaA [Kordiimonas laminariae]MCK0069581.1 Na+/H+ antiporter NhaA [Kordiimonas laminariae]